MVTQFTALGVYLACFVIMIKRFDWLIRFYSFSKFGTYQIECLTLSAKDMYGSYSVNVRVAWQHTCCNWRGSWAWVKVLGIQTPLPNKINKNEQKLEINNDEEGAGFC